jgi:hypothetical protein
MSRKSVSVSLLCVAFASTLVPPPSARAGAPPAPVEPGDLLASTGNIGGDLIDVDPATGAGTFRAGLGAFGPVTEIEFRADGVLFATTGQGTSNLLTVDPDTGVETLVGQHQPGSVNGLEFVGDTLYGGFFAPGNPAVGPEGATPSFLVTVDQDDGTLTIVGPLDVDPVRGLAYDEASATMFGVAPAPVSAGEGLGDVLFTVDLATGATTPVGATGFLVGALEFGPDGVLYGAEASPGPGVGEGSARLLVIDPATGAGAVVGPTGSPAVSGLAFVPEGGPSVLEVPSLSGLGLALLAALLAAAGFVALRRG